MKKKSAFIVGSILLGATQGVHADLIDTFTRSDGPVGSDSIGVTESGSQKYSYMERMSPNGPDFMPDASIQSNNGNPALYINGVNVGTTALSQAGSPGLVYLEGYNSNYLTVSADISFDSGSYNNNTAAIQSGSMLTNTAGFVLRAPVNMDYNTPNDATQQGLVDCTIGSNGDILIREVQSGNTLATIYSKNPFSNAANTHKILPGKLPATIGGEPFDTNQDGLLEPNETFNFSVSIYSSGAGFDIVQPFINGQALGADPINNPAGGTLQLNGSASGINGVALLKNRTSSATTYNIVSNAYFDNLSIDNIGSGPTNQTWGVDSDGSWSTGSNWSSGTPFGVDCVANFGNAISAPHTVTLDASQVVGTLNFSSTNPYTIAAHPTSTTVGTTTTSLTTGIVLATSTGPVGINVMAGNQTIAAGVEMKGDGTYSVASSSSLAITGTVLAPGRTLTKTGSGPLQMGAMKVGTFSLTGGNASITAKTNPNTTSGTSVVNNLSIGAGLGLDLTNNDMVLDYSNGGVADPAKLAAMRSMIKSGYANGAWTGTGLTSSTAAASAADGATIHKSALGYAEASSLALATFDGIAVDADAIVVKYTISGDANLDGTVNSTDFSLMAAAYGTGTAWAQGDFNYDGTVNALDFNAIATNYGLTVAATPGAVPALGALVPEPMSAGVIALGGAALGLQRRRFRGGKRVAF